LSGPTSAVSAVSDDGHETTAGLQQSKRLTDVPEVERAFLGAPPGSVAEGRVHQNNRRARALVKQRVSVVGVLRSHVEPSVVEGLT
jgi:hypothetical protein